MDDQFKLRVEADIELELLADAHAEELFALTDRNREYLRRWLPWLDSNKYLQNTVDFIKFSRKQYEENNSLQLCIRYKGGLAGVIGFNKVDWLNHSTGIGYWLSEDCQGKGIMTASCGCLLDYAFGNLGMNRAEIRCAIENKRSRAIPERLGFREEGTIRQAEWLYDHYVDHVVYGLLREEWKGGA
jgi:ribosomal-protein-serine acetyltransferase